MDGRCARRIEHQRLKLLYNLELEAVSSNTKATTLLEDLAELFNDEATSDFKLLFESTTIHVHQILLYHRCPSLLNYASKNIADTNFSSTITLSNFTKFLQCIYYQYDEAYIIQSKILANIHAIFPIKFKRLGLLLEMSINADFIITLTKQRQKSGGEYDFKVSSSSLSVPESQIAFLVHKAIFCCRSKYLKRQAAICKRVLRLPSGLMHTANIPLLLHFVYSLAKLDVKIFTIAIRNHLLHSEDEKSDSLGSHLDCADNDIHEFNRSAQVIKQLLVASQYLEFCLLTANCEQWFKVYDYRKLVERSSPTPDAVLLFYKLWKWASLSAGSNSNLSRFFLLKAYRFFETFETNVFEPDTVNHVQELPDVEDDMQYRKIFCDQLLNSPYIAMPKSTLVEGIELAGWNTVHVGTTQLDVDAITLGPHIVQTGRHREKIRSGDECTVDQGKQHICSSRVTASTSTTLPGEDEIMSQINEVLSRIEATSSINGFLDRSNHAISTSEKTTFHNNGMEPLSDNDFIKVTLSYFLIADKLRPQLEFLYFSQQLYPKQSSSIKLPLFDDAIHLCKKLSVRYNQLPENYTLILENCTSYNQVGIVNILDQAGFTHSLCKYGVVVFGEKCTKCQVNATSAWPGEKFYYSRYEHEPENDMIDSQPRNQLKNFDLDSQTSLGDITLRLQSLISRRTARSNSSRRNGQRSTGQRVLLPNQARFDNSHFYRQLSPKARYYRHQKLKLVPNQHRSLPNMTMPPDVNHYQSSTNSTTRVYHKSSTLL